MVLTEGEVGILMGTGKQSHCNMSLDGIVLNRQIKIRHLNQGKMGALVEEIREDSPCSFSRLYVC